MLSPCRHLGRRYNPLQYIRNRKVRARERKAIDGEAQGFRDVVKVTDWVDDVARWAATGQSQSPGSSLLPPFNSSSDALVPSEQFLPTGPRQPIPTAKPKRPRVDWVVDPADMLADIYWLEQDDNKKLVEDRQWHRVFPQDSELYRPATRQTEETTAAALVADSRPESRRQAAEEVKPEAVAITPESKRTSRSEHENVLSTARERARQKLQDIRGHHRHHSSIHIQDIFKSRKGELSDSSDTDAETKKRNRTRDHQCYRQRRLGEADDGDDSP